MEDIDVQINDFIFLMAKHFMQRLAIFMEVLVERHGK